MFEIDLAQVMFEVGKEPNIAASFAFPPDMSSIGMMGDEGTPSGAVDTFHAGRPWARSKYYVVSHKCQISFQFIFGVLRGYVSWLNI